MAKFKANISFQPVVESINRKFALRKEKCSLHNVGGRLTIQPTGYMGAGTRKHNINGYGWVKTNYFFMRKNARSTAISQDEIVARSNFTAVAKWVTVLMKNLATLTANQEKYEQCVANQYAKCQGVSAWGYAGMRSWVFAVGMAILADGDSLPQDYALPSVTVG